MPKHPALAREAKRINAELAQAEADWRSALQHAMNAGQLMLDVKARLPHGQFGSWLKQHVSLGEREARNYMRLAANRQLVAEMPSIRAAVAYLAEPKPELIEPEPEPESAPQRSDFPPDIHASGVDLSEAKYLLAVVDWHEDRIMAGYSAWLADAQNVIDELGPDAGAALLAKSATGLRFYTIQRELSRSEDDAYDKLFPQVQAAWMAYRAACDGFYSLRGEPLMNDRPLEFEDALYHPALRALMDEDEES